ncbi:Protein-lysine N-methyltransferase efm4 [Coemansia furcata]|uniref:Protein-lysine N-methyltransferase efm4 n=1 Tax=Coemansia furcata TaxID=417177 RepID=A0ACC1LIJ1_9FUNG|nr:Protein-lysine N-methyltransferase efm4 [Coemansia furcata]
MSTIDELSGEALRVELAKDKSHHQNGRFANPWPSFAIPPFWAFLKDVLFSHDRKAVNKSIAEGRIPQVVPLDRTLINGPAAGQLQVTWLGHASLLVQVDGATILCDPVFSQRCSPSQWIGPKRYTQAACQVAELPDVIDALIVSHNHYDHLDWNTLCDVAKRYPDIRVYSPLGNREILESAGFRNVFIGDWWDEFQITVPGIDGEFILACTPAQHMTARGAFDRMASLWSSWVVKGPTGGKFFFSGDTAYSSLHGSQGAECPAFKQIGRVYGPIDLAAIAIGAYAPEYVFSSVHVNPEQAVRIHEDVRSKKSIGIHWGTFILTNEPADEPPIRLRGAMEARGHGAEEFSVTSIGETALARPLTSTI